MGLRDFERRLENLVEGTFNKAFRSGLQPVEIGRKLTRELDANRSLSVRGTVAPNDIVVELSEVDFGRFADFADALVKELEETAREHARDEHYEFVGPLSVALVTDDDLRAGALRLIARIVEGQGGRAGSLVLPNGERIRLESQTVTIGRLGSQDIVIDDPQVSREHAEVRPDLAGYLVIDKQSMNGTKVNGKNVTEHRLEDGDVITVGTYNVAFEQS